jgi:hypothetical protein
VPDWRSRRRCSMICRIRWRRRGSRKGLDVVCVSRVPGHASPPIRLDVYADLLDRARSEERATAALETEYARLLTEEEQ